MWAKELFRAFTENDIIKEKELINLIPLTTKNSMQSLRSVYKKSKEQGMTPFIAAILLDDTELCEQLIKEGIDFNQQCSAGQFDEARFNQFGKEVDKLIELGPKNYAFIDFNKTTPMFWAIRCDKFSLVEQLMHRGHNINGCVEKVAGMPTLSYAILCKNEPVVKYFLSNQPCDIHPNSLPDLKPLDLAIRSGNLEMVRLLMKHGGETPDCPNHQLSPLSLAVFLNDISMVSLLLDMGASVSFGEESGKFFPPLNMAILRSHFEVACILIKKGADVTVKDSIGKTALHMLLPFMKTPVFANQPSSIALARLLLEKGARVDVENDKGEIPLLEALFQCEPEFFNLFLSNPVDLNSLWNLKPKATLLHIAVSSPYMFGSSRVFNMCDSKGYWEKRCSLVKSLLIKGADVNFQLIEDGRTPLHFAAESGRADFVQLLLQKSKSKVDVNRKTKYGKVALHYAAYSGSSAVVRLLLESGAEVNVTEVRGSMPLDCGISENKNFSYDTTKLLIDYGADINNSCMYGQTKIYNVIVGLLRPELVKLFWRQGYPYDETQFPNRFNSSTAPKKSLLHNLEMENLAIANFQKKMNIAGFIQLEGLMKAQAMFIKGIQNNNVKLVRDAIQRGAEVEGSSVHVPFPLHFLAKHGFTQVAQVLLSRSVKVNTVNCEGKIPIDLAAEFGHFNMYLDLLRSGACYNRVGFDPTILQKKKNCNIYKMYLLINNAFKSVKEGHGCILESLNAFLKLKKWHFYFAFVNCIDKNGRTLMSCAVAKGNVAIAQKLMEYRLRAFHASV